MWKQPPHLSSLAQRSAGTAHTGRVLAGVRGAWWPQPTNSSRGRGVRMVTKPSELGRDVKDLLVQHYVHNPLTINGVLPPWEASTTPHRGFVDLWRGITLLQGCRRALRWPALACVGVAATVGVRRVFHPSSPARLPCANAQASSSTCASTCWPRASTRCACTSTTTAWRASPPSNTATTRPTSSEMGNGLLLECCDAEPGLHISWVCGVPGARDHLLRQQPLFPLPRASLTCHTATLCVCARGPAGSAACT